MLFPRPQSIELSGEAFVVAPSLTVTVLGEESDRVTAWFKKRGIACGQNGNILIKLTANQSREMTYVSENRQVTDEKYCLECEVLNGVAEIRVVYAGLRGLWYAFNTIVKQLKSGSLIVGKIVDYPLFKVRGYIEGFYGKPWTTSERADMLQLMSAHGMNTYYYAPKDDPYHRSKWSELYPETELRDLKALIQKAQDGFVNFCFCIAPGLSMKYSSDEDYALLLNKIKQIYALGGRTFGLLLDDIPENLHYPEDIAMFSSETVNAHAYLANKLYDDLMAFDNRITLTLCPLQYNGKGDEYFISKLGQSIEPEISLFWTGRNICSQELTVPEAITFIQSTRHRPLYWDNFPVNDAEMYNEMHLGYIFGRDKDLYRYSEGLIANCMEFCECSKIPLLTIADYLWNPEAYEPLSSWDYAIDTVAGDRAELFKYFADNLLTSCLKVPNSPMLAQTFSLAEQELRAGDMMAAFDRIINYKMNLAACCEMLKDDSVKLFAELSRWSKKMILCSEILELGFEYLTDPEEEQRIKIGQLLHEFIRMPEVLTDFAFKSAVEALIAGEFM